MLGEIGRTNIAMKNDVFCDVFASVIKFPQIFSDFPVRVVKHVKHVVTTTGWNLYTQFHMFT